MKELIEIRNRLSMASHAIGISSELELELLSSLISPSIPSSTTDPSLLLAFYLTITTGQPIMLTITLAAALSSVAVVQAETVLGAVSMPLHYLPIHC